jgi:hypothetical protein
MSNSTEEVAPKSKTPKRRRWRRWVIALFILLVLLGGLVAMAPMLASSGTGKSMILAKVNGQLTGKANVDKLDVGWFGHLDVTGVTLNDPQGRQVLAIPSIHRSGGLWDLLRSKQVGSVQIDKPQLTLYIDRNGRISLMDALPSTPPAAQPAPAAPAPAQPVAIQAAPAQPAPAQTAASDPAQQLHQLIQLGINLAIRDGRVQVIKETGEKLDISAIQVTASVAPAGAPTAAAASAPATQAGAPVVAGERMSYSLQCAVTADLPAPPPPASAPAEPNAAPAETGPSHVELAIDTAGSIGPAPGGLGIDHTTSFKNVVMTRGSQTIRPGPTAIRLHAAFDQNAKNLSLSEAAVDSDFLRLQVSGQVRQYDTQGRIDLKGTLWANGQSITQQVRTLTGHQEFTLATDPQKQMTFHVAGPLRQPQRWGTDGLTGEVQIGWQQFAFGPIQAGPLDLTCKLQNDRILITPTAMPVNKGQANLAGTIVLIDPQHPGTIAPVLYLKDYTAVVDKLSLDQAISTQLISKINPAAFYRPQSISGTTTVHLQDVEMPLSGAALKTGKIGKGRIDFADLVIEPRKDDVMAGLLGILGGATGSTGVGKMQIPGADFRLADGRIYYDDFHIVWAGLYDIKFSGSVGLDGSVDLTAGLPVTPGMVRTLIELPPLPGAAEKVVQGLGQTYIPVRIHGSRDNMQMDKAGLTSGLKQAMQNLLKTPQGAVGGLKDVLQGAVGGVLGGGGGGSQTPSGGSSGGGGSSSAGGDVLHSMEGAIGSILPGKPHQPAAASAPANRPFSAPAAGSR